MRNLALLGWIWILTGCAGGQFDFGKDDTGTVEGCPSILVNTEDILFSNTRIGLPQAAELVITNGCAGETLLEVAGILDSGPELGFFVNEAVWVLEPGEQGRFDLTYVAHDYQRQETVLTLVTNDPEREEIAITLQGQAAADQDGDGVPAEAVGGSDCDDFNPGVYPGAEDVFYDGVDANCDGLSDFDQDGDGHDRIPEGLDCDDLNPAVYPDQEEILNQKDDNCDGYADETWAGEGDVLITEVMMDPAATFDTTGEWIELFNASNRDLNLVGWSLIGADGDETTIDDELLIPAGQYAVLGVSDDMSSNGGADVDYVYDRSDFSLNNDADTIKVVVGRLEVSALEYNSDWPVQPGASLSLDVEALDTSSLSNPGLWCSATEGMAGGDSGSPGQANALCDTVDHDGDGYTVDTGDCDDTDASIHPDQIDWMNGLDEDCDGYTDQTTIDDLYSGWVKGRTTGSTLGGPEGLSLGDVDNDGQVDVLIGAPLDDSYTGVVYVLDGSGVNGYDDKASKYATGTIDGPGRWGMFGRMDVNQADNTGDGVADLVIGGIDYYSYYSSKVVLAALFPGGNTLSGGLDIDDASMTWGESGSWDEAAVLSSLDMTGDGVAEVVLGHPHFRTNRDGAFGLFDTSALSSGAYELDDADQILTGSRSYQRLGTGASGADIDRDGYDDLLMCGAGYYWSSSTTQASPGCWLMMGSGTLGEDDDVADVAVVSFVEAATATTSFGDVTLFGDVDDDGKTDLLLSAAGLNEVYVYLDVAGLTGQLDSSDADATLVGTSSAAWFGRSMVMGDMNDDGVDDLVISAPDLNSNLRYPGTGGVGEVYVFEGGGTWSGRYTERDAGWTVKGSENSDGFGYSMLFSDLDGDGVPEWVVAAPGHDALTGRVYFSSLK